MISNLMAHGTAWSGSRDPFTQSNQITANLMPSRSAVSHQDRRISRVQGHIVPTALAYNGAFYVGNLDTFPIKDGSSKIMKITAKGEITTVFIGFSDILGLAFDSKGRLYVLENTTGNPSLTPNTGKLLRVNGKNNYTEIATKLSLPTAMTFGPDGNLYVSNLGIGSSAGSGQVLKVTVP